MSISPSLSFPSMFQDDGVPAASYMDIMLPIYAGQLFLNQTNNDLYICNDASDQEALVWERILREDQIPTQVNSDWSSSSGVSLILNKPTISAAQIQSDWNQTSSGSLDFIKNKPVRTQSGASRTLNSAFQISSTRDAFANYSVDIACVLTLTTGQTGTVFLEIATNASFTTGVQEVGRTVNGNTGSLTLGLNITQNATATIGGYIPAGYYVRLRTANTSGTPVFTYQSGQEVLL